MKKHLLLFLWIVLNMSVIAQTIDEKYIEQNFTKIERNIPMRDGTKLFTSIYIPKSGNEKYPILLNRTPYTVAPYGEDKVKSSLGNFPDMAKSGYIFVYQDVRGKWMSEGVFENIRPTRTKANNQQIDESTDTYDTIDWLIKNIKNNNGKVGMYGISYPGFYSTASLIGSHPALKAVSPQAPVTDWFIGDDFRHGGALFLMDAFRFMYTFDAPREKPITNIDPAAPTGFSLQGVDYYKFFNDNLSIPKLREKYLNHTVKFWEDLAKHNTRDTFWTSRTITEHLGEVKPAVMIVGGLFDAEDAYGTFETYKKIEQSDPKANNILVVGPWFHGGWVRSDGDSFGDIDFNSKTSLYYQREIELPFFDYYLKGKGTFNPSEATIFFTGENNWKKLNQWPPREAHEQSLYLTPEMKLTSSNTAPDKEFIEYVSDPKKPVPFQEGVISDRTREYMIDDQRFVSNRPDVAVFQTEVLTEDLTLAGPIVADLIVSMSGSDADFVVKIIDVYPDTSTAQSPRNSNTVMPGYQMLIRGEILRGKFRDSFSEPKPFKNGEKTPVKVRLPDVAHTFKKGHKLMVHIQHSWFPLVGQNPNQFMNEFDATEKDYIKNTHRIYFDPERPSKISFNTLN